jgi:hypothetical protein
VVSIGVGNWSLKRPVRGGIRGGAGTFCPGVRGHFIRFKGWLGPGRGI